MLLELVLVLLVELVAMVPPRQAGLAPGELTAVAVTNRPGLKGPLIVGTNYAK